MDAAARVAGQAVAMAKLSAKVIAAAGSHERVELADEPVHAEKTWVSAYDIDPFEVPDEEKSGLLAEWSARLLRAEGVAHVDASLLTVHENKFYADTAAPSPHSSASGCTRSSRRSQWTARAASSTRCARSRRRPAGAGSI